MSTDVTDEIEALDDKQAIYIVQRLSQALFTQVTPPDVSTMLTAIDQAGLGPVDLKMTNASDLSSALLPQNEGGAIARSLLHSWATEPNLALAVEKAIERFKTAKQDFGILSIPVALGLTYALIAMDLDIDLGFAKIKKSGISGSNQANIVKKTLSPLLKALQTAGT